jgi:TPR repeat protein
MARTTRPIVCAITVYEGSPIRKLTIGLLLLSLLYVIGISNTPASTLASANYTHDSVTQQFDLHTIGYRAQWLEAVRADAKHASDDDEPYLANRLWALLANQGDRDAAFRLGLYYDVGAGEERDAQRAVYWYRQAAEAGEIHAQHNLGVAYAKGDGIAMDINQAIKWWTLAARRGNADSQYNLGILYAAGEYGIKQDIDQAKHWWRRAAMHGDPMAQYNLGTLYVNNGVHDYCEATRWWEEAAKNGVEQASQALRVIKTRQDYRACQ